MRCIGARVHVTSKTLSNHISEEWGVIKSDPVRLSRYDALAASENDRRAVEGRVVVRADPLAAAVAPAAAPAAPLLLAPSAATDAVARRTRV